MRLDGHRINCNFFTRIMKEQANKEYKGVCAVALACQVHIRGTNTHNTQLWTDGEPFLGLGWKVRLRPGLAKHILLPHLEACDIFDWRAEAPFSVSSFVITLSTLFHIMLRIFPAPFKFLKCLYWGRVAIISSERSCGPPHSYWLKHLSKFSSFRCWLVHAKLCTFRKLTWHTLWTHPWSWRAHQFSLKSEAAKTTDFQKKCVGICAFVFRPSKSLSPWPATALHCKTLASIKFSREIIFKAVPDARS